PGRPMGSQSTPIRAGTVSAFRIPTQQPESDGTAKWDSTTVVLVELEAAGRKGLGFSYAQESAATVAKALLEKVVLGSEAFDIPAIHARMDRESRNWGRPGVVSTAISAVD